MRKFIPWILTGAMTITMSISSYFYSESKSELNDKLKTEYFRVNALRSIIDSNKIESRKRVIELSFEIDSLKTVKSKTVSVEYSVSVSKTIEDYHSLNFEDSKGESYKVDYLIAKDKNNKTVKIIMQK